LAENRTTKSGLPSVVFAAGGLLDHQTVAAEGLQEAGGVGGVGAEMLPQGLVGDRAADRGFRVTVLGREGDDVAELRELSKPIG